MAEILPFRDSFNSLFFISIGMLLDLRVLLAHPVLVMGLVVALVGGKMVTTVGAAVVTGFSWRAAVLTSIALAQIGEFSFILAKVGRSLGLLPGESFQVFLTVSVLTLLLTPFLLQASPRLARRAEALQRLRRWLPERQADPHEIPSRHLIARTRYLREIEDLRATGADQVVPEEFETSIEIFSLVLQHYRMPARVIAEKAERIRQEGYALFRKGQPGLKEIVAKEADDLYVDD